MKAQHKVLTPVHLQDAVLALDVGQGVAHLDAVGVTGDVFADVLVDLVRAALWVDVVAAFVALVDQARISGVGSAVKGVTVEAFLIGHTVRVVHVADVAKEELEVPLSVGGGGGWVQQVVWGDDHTRARTHAKIATTEVAVSGSFVLEGIIVFFFFSAKRHTHAYLHYVYMIPRT